MSMDRVTVKRPPAHSPMPQPGSLVILNPVVHENRAQRRRHSSRFGSMHPGSKKRYHRGAFGGRTVAMRLAKIKQTCPDLRRARPW